ncbi:MAG: hypothetical protein LBS79_03115 [Tannerella sp.]|jgi:hypothetical protein|nr:hypothetical protein [Tannerella sp.]
MDKKLFLWMTSLILAFFSCNNDTNVPSNEEENVTGETSELFVVTRALGIEDMQAFEGKDIKSFNVETGEITFKNLAYSDICGSLVFDQKLAFYIDDELLFTASAVGSFSSRMINDLVFYYDGGRMYLKDGYPVFDHLSDPSRIAEIIRERQEAAAKRQPAWDRFISYLDENNLLTDETSEVPENNGGGEDTPVVPPIYDLSATITVATEGGEYPSTVFIGKSIRSFNPETREIIFDGSNILANLNQLAPIPMNVFREGSSLFDATVIASDKPQTVNDLVFFIEVKKQNGYYYGNEFKYYLLDGYPGLDEVANRNEAEELRQENAQKRKAAWDTFIGYLNGEGKIVIK